MVICDGLLKFDLCWVFWWKWMAIFLLLCWWLNLG